MSFGLRSIEDSLYAAHSVSFLDNSNIFTDKCTMLTIQSRPLLDNSFMFMFHHSRQRWFLPGHVFDLYAEHVVTNNTSLLERNKNPRIIEEKGETNDSVSRK